MYWCLSDLKKKNMATIIQAAFSMHSAGVQNMNSMFVYGLFGVLGHFR